MEIKEDGGVSLDYNETLFITRHMANNYRNAKKTVARYERSIHWYNTANVTNIRRESMIESYQKQVTKYKERAALYSQWYNLYELLLKNKRFKK